MQGDIQVSRCRTLRRIERYNAGQATRNGSLIKLMIARKKTPAGSLKRNVKVSSSETVDGVIDIADITHRYYSIYYKIRYRGQRKNILLPSICLCLIFNFIQNF